MLTFTLTILLTTVFVLPQSFVYYKLPFLLFSVVAILLNAMRGSYKIRSPSVPLFYLVFSILAIIWASIGAVRGNPDQAITESVTLYVVYMWVYAILVLHISNSDYFRILVPFLSWSALGVSFFCFYLLFDFIFGIGWISDAVREEMYLRIGVHDGYIQMNNVNVGMFTFLIPFLLSSILVSGRSIGKFPIFALMIAVVAVFMASRRIVFVLLLITPALTYLVYRLAGRRDGALLRRCGGTYLATIVVGALVVGLLFHYQPSVMDGMSDRVLEIFVVDDNSIRQIQHRALLDGFQEYPVFGSGFGGLTEVVRSMERPWTYELTYSKLLYNSGLVGMLLLLAFFSTYVVAVIGRIRQNSANIGSFIPLLVGLICVLVASASNPYLSSFDFLFVLSVIPLILNSPGENVESRIDKLPKAIGR